MFDFRFCFCNLTGKSLFRTFQLGVPVEVFLCIFSRSKGGIKRNGNLFVCIIIQGLKGLAAFLQTVSVGIDQLAVDPVFFLFGSILHLFCLKGILLSVSFKGSLNDPAKVRRFLADTVQGISGRIVGGQHGRYGFKFHAVIFRSELGQRKNGIFYRFISAINDIWSKIPFLYLLHQSFECMIQMDAGGFIQREGRVIAINGCAVTDFLCNKRT